MKKILVIGSVNVDHVYDVDKMPEVGETIKSNMAKTYFGGKGANQAVAAAKYGADVSFLGAIGDDQYAKQVIENFNNYNVKIPKLKVIKGVNTGTACIFIVNGDNSIVIEQGANAVVNNDFVLNNIEYINSFDFILVQNEISASALVALIDIIKDSQTIIYNPAPYEKIDSNIIERIDFITPNETEYRQLLEHGFVIPREKLIITLGEVGVQYCDEVIPTPLVNVKDTTGAGDCFNGVLAAALSQGESINNAINLGVKSASFSTTMNGAQSGYLSKEELKNKLSEIKL